MASAESNEFGVGQCGPPPTYSSVDEIQPIINQYFDIPANMPFRVSVLCTSLKMTRETLCEYEKKDVFSDIIKEAKLNIEDDLVFRGLTGESQSTFSIFILKNSFGYKDKSEVEATVRKGAPLTKEKAKKIIDELG